MFCKRCGKEFDRAELRPPSLVLRLLAAPFLLFMLRSRVVRGEVTALYCRPCRRSLNVSFLFVAFMVVVVGTVLLLQYLGIGPPQKP